MKLLSLLPLLYLFTKFRTQGLFKNRDFASTKRTHKINMSWDIKMQEPHEQRNRQEEKPRKHRTQQLHKSKSCTKAKSTITKGLTTVEILQKGHPESSLHQLTGSVFLSLQSPTDTVIPKRENFRNIASHCYLKTPYHTQRIFL